MTRNQISENTRAILSDILCVKPADCIDAAKLDKDLGADSLDAIHIVMEVEKCFNIIISDAEIEAISTVRDIIDIVSAKLGN